MNRTCLVFCSFCPGNRIADVEGTTATGGPFPSRREIRPTGPEGTTKKLHKTLLHLSKQTDHWVHGTVWLCPDDSFASQLHRGNVQEKNSSPCASRPGACPKPPSYDCKQESYVQDIKSKTSTSQVWAFQICWCEHLHPKICFAFKNSGDECCREHTHSVLQVGANATYSPAQQTCTTHTFSLLGTTHKN